MAFSIIDSVVTLLTSVITIITWRYTSLPIKFSVNRVTFVEERDRWSDHTRDVP
jgi:hypothetical protein